MSKELEALEELFKTTYFGSKEEYDKINNCYNSIKQALQRLEAIDNAIPSEAIKSLEKIKDSFGCDMAYYGLSLEYETIEQYILKAQEQEKIVKEYDLKPYELREALLLYAMYKGEYKGNPLPKLKQAQENEKVLEIIKKKKVNCYIEIMCCDTYDEYLQCDNIAIYKLTKEEFELLKRWAECQKN